MPFFKTTHNILVAPWEDELWNDNWMDSDKLILPPKVNWDYSREMKLEDVDIWEVIYYQGGGLGYYASWSPYAEFYMITHHLFMYRTNSIETYYGPKAQEKSYKRALELGIPVSLNKFWVEPEDMWLYEEEYKDKKGTIIT